MTEQFRPELFDDSDDSIHANPLARSLGKVKLDSEDVVIDRLFLLVFTYMFLWLT
jgi:hypothetical protein